MECLPNINKVLNPVPHTQKELDAEAGEMAQNVRMLAILPEDLCWLPSTHVIFTVAVQGILPVV